MHEQKVAIVTGSSSGIGLETSLELARNGFYTYASMRNIEKSKKIEEIAKNQNLPLSVIQLDVNDEESITEAIEAISNEKNRIDVLVNNAGYGVFGSLEDLSVEEMKDQFETNFFGVVRVTKKVLPLMRRRLDSKRTIVNISSVGGCIGAPILSAYQSTKFALEGLSESLYYELLPFGIRVVIVEPGFIQTNIMNSSIMAKNGSNHESPYFQLTQTIEKYFRSMVNDNSDATPALHVANTIIDAVKADTPDLRYPVGNDAKTILEARKKLNDREFVDLIKNQLLTNQ